MKLRNILTTSLLCLSLLFVPNTLHAQKIPNQSLDETLEAQVTNVVKDGVIENEFGTHPFQRLEMEVLKGSLKGRVIIVENGNLDSSNLQRYKEGDKLQVVMTKDIEGQEIFFITDYVRRTPLLVLALFFIVCTVLVGGIWGATSLIGMAFSFVIIFTFILPQLLAGHDPILIAVIGSAAIIPVTFYLSHGFNVKTHVAIVGTLITLVVIGILASFFVEFTRLSGYSSEEAGFLQNELSGKINIKGLLLAGMIISSLGILDDITISQSSVIKELKEANKKLSQYDLFSRGMRVGRDHIASLVNTLILVYAGASLPLLLLFLNNPHPFSEIINYEIIAEEIVKTLIGSIGLILAVPITTALAVVYFNRRK